MDSFRVTKFCGEVRAEGIGMPLTGGEVMARGVMGGISGQEANPD